MSLNRKDGGEGDTRQERVDQRRRRLTTAGAAAVPAFFVLRHRSVRAQTPTPSAGSAGSISDSTVRLGQPPSYWRNRPDRWPSSFDPGSPKVENLARQEMPRAGGTRFFDVFQPSSHFPASEPERLTLMDVLRLRGEDDPHRLGAYFVAALLNAETGMTEPLPAGQVQEMWQQWSTRGCYSPPPGVDSWYAEDIKRYFETTWA